MTAATWELPLVFVAGLLGSSHCLGMCGPFALSIGSGATSWPNNLLRQTLYSLGRLFTYGTLGAAAGFAGLRLTQSLPAIVSIPAVLALVAGVWMLYTGLSAAGVLPRRAGTSVGGGCLAGSWFAPFLEDRHGTGFFLAGMFTGLLPCGLVYAFCTLAASSTSLFRGSATMLAFGSGTIPLMLLAGLGGGLLRWEARRRLLHLAAWCVVAGGLISIARGTSALWALDSNSQSACPFCSGDVEVR